jgi:hypothetical protein
VGSVETLSHFCMRWQYGLGNDVFLFHFFEKIHIEIAPCSSAGPTDVAKTSRHEHQGELPFENVPTTRARRRTSRRMRSSELFVRMQQLPGHIDGGWNESERPVEGDII